MTPQEFKAWFDGFTENVDKQPTQKQWARIKERVAEIDGKPVTERVYVDRYLPSPYIPYYRGLWATTTGGPNSIGNVWTSAQCSVAANSAANNAANNAATTGIAGKVSVPEFDSLSAMHLLGQTDAAALAA